MPECEKRRITLHDAFVCEGGNCWLNRTWGIWWSEKEYAGSLASTEKQSWMEEDEVMLHSFQARCYVDARSIHDEYMDEWLNGR